MMHAKLIFFFFVNRHRMVYDLLLGHITGSAVGTDVRGLQIWKTASLAHVHVHSVSALSAGRTGAEEQSLCRCHMQICKATGF